MLTCIVKQDAVEGCDGGTGKPMLSGAIVILFCSTPPDQASSESIRDVQTS
ncbi:hypothetical protein OP10G_3908 [Fimbriimonas ginsengisoli Gsoil 348]|uniref:Uncharacterized protein n=1 Tax=Fimbriimonas ginsengisoli Gsoil 348 TaxID=661478 RepID=A0A068NUZ6_FIMGI|nr:hypothetical protein OP10G_3908 [Fimbriimonas ginsengisoli Gsoil 348]